MLFAVLAAAAAAVAQAVGHRPGDQEVPGSMLE